MPGMRYKFIMADPDGDTDKLTFCGVEELVMEHYKNNGYPEGKNQNPKSDFMIDNFFIFTYYHRNSSHFMTYYFRFTLIFENLIIKKSQMSYQYDTSIYCTVDS